MYQWKTSSVIHVTSILPGTTVSVSQLLQIERHRGKKYSTIHSPSNEQEPNALPCGDASRPPLPLTQDGRDFPAGSVPAVGANRRTDLTTMQIPVHGSLRGRIQRACDTRPAPFHDSCVEGYGSVSKICRRHASHSIGRIPPVLKHASKKPLSTRTGPNPPRIPQLVPNKLSTGFKIPTKSVKRVEDDFHEIEPGEGMRAWPLSSEERKAEAKRREEARLLSVAQEKKAREAQETAMRRDREEQQRREAEAILLIHLEAQRVKALAVEQKNRELRERRMARLSVSAVHLDGVRVQIDDIRSQIEKLLDECEAARRRLWEQQAKTVQMVFDAIMKEKERSSYLVTKYSNTSTLLCAAIAEFCMAVGAQVHVKRFTTLVGDSYDFDGNDFLPRYMFAEGDTPHRTKRLCEIFWMYQRLKNFEDEMTFEAHIWRHLRSARMLHALNPKAFAYKPFYADWYCRMQRFDNELRFFEADFKFWHNHTEFEKPPFPSRQQRGSPISAKATRRNDLVYFLTVGASDIRREMSRMFDHGNFDLGHNSTDFGRQQQIALRKPFTHVREKFRETEELLVPFVPLLYYVDTNRGKTRRFLENVREEFRMAANIVRPYFKELDVFTYWNWLATERHVPQKRMSYRKVSQLSTVDADVPRDEPTLAFHQNCSRDQTWRYNNYLGPSGQQVIVDYCVTHQYAERTASLFANKKVVGIDLWGGRRFANIEDAVRKGNSPKRCIPMIALASEERVALFHVASMSFHHYLTRLPTLVRILEDPAICKVGENTRAFQRRLSTYIGINMLGAVDLESAHVQPLSSSQKDSINPSSPALAMFSKLSVGYPPEPHTTTTLSDELKKHVGQSLYDDTVNPEELQTNFIPSPKLIQLSTSRPYAALQLHKIIEQRTATTSQQPQALVTEPKSSKASQLGFPVKPANVSECTTLIETKEAAAGFSDGRVQHLLALGSAVAEHDLGPMNIDPWLEKGVRDYRLEKLATALAKVILGQTESVVTINHITAYVLFTRFGQSCEDIHRILHVQEPADAILELVKATDLPLSEAMSALLEAEKESMLGSTPRSRATVWIKKIIADAPLLLRMYRRNLQTRVEFETYAMWHRLEMSVAEIAQTSREPQKQVFRRIKKTLKLGNPPVFPFRRARYLSLLYEHAPRDYVEELERPIDEVSAPSAPWGATADVLLMTGLESFDEEDFLRYIVGQDDAPSLPLFRETKQLVTMEKADAPKAAEVAKTAKVFKTSKICKIAQAIKTTKSASMFRNKVFSLSDASHSRKKLREVSTLRNVPSSQQRLVRSSQGSVRKPKGKVLESVVLGEETTPNRETVLGKNASSSKKKTDSGDPGWSQALAVWTPIEISTSDPGTANRQDPVQQSKVPTSISVRRRRRRAAKLLQEKASDKAGKSSYNERKSSVREDNDLKTKGQSLDTDIPITRLRSERKLYKPGPKTGPHEGQSLDADIPDRRCKSNVKPAMYVTKRGSSSERPLKPHSRSWTMKAPNPSFASSISNRKHRNLQYRSSAGT